MGDEDISPRASRDAGDGPPGLTWLERFVEKYWKTMPAPVRIPLFVLFCLVLIYGLYRPIGGEFSVRGVLLQKSVDDQAPVFASDHEVVIADRHYGVNSVGEYYCVLGSKDYARLLFRGKWKIEVIDRKTSVPSWPEVNFNRLDQEFDVITLPATPGPKPSEVGEGRLPDEPFAAPHRSLIPAAWASPVVVPKVNFALVLIAVKFTSDTNARTGRFSLRLDEDTLPLLSSRTEGAATYFPVVPGQKVRLPSLSYFNLPLPEHETADIVGELFFDVEGGFSQVFRSNRETFAFRLPHQPGSQRTLRGSLGSEVDVLLVGPYRVVLFDKADVASEKDPLQAELLHKGFLLTIRPYSPLGTGAQTNALFGGKQVPFQAVQAVLGVLRNHSIPVKTIQYQLDLKSGNTLEIQIGGSAAFERRSPIPKTLLDGILAVNTEEEFRDKIRPYALTSTQPAKGRPVPRKRKG